MWYDRNKELAKGLEELSEADCWIAGYQRGAEDARDGYTAAIENPDLGEGYPFRWRYEQGYRQAYFFNLEKEAQYTASELGRRGGQSTSPAKVAAARKNGQKGGRPRKVSG